MRVRLKKWGTDHLVPDGKKVTLCGLMLPFNNRFEPRGKRVCAQCRKLAERNASGPRRMR